MRVCSSPGEAGAHHWPGRHRRSGSLDLSQLKVKLAREKALVCKGTWRHAVCFRLQAWAEQAFGKDSEQLFQGEVLAWDGSWQKTEVHEEERFAGLCRAARLAGRRSRGY
ncbi:unnamed protein product [Symbiodinium sp. CCMP2592]|nr:unnamed protein product [Symbiodinium sp. CCMP2592]